MIDRLVRRARNDRAFAAIGRKFAAAKVESWIQDEEKALLFGVGAYARGKGEIVEIGSFQGGSACFLAGGLARRRRGRLTCIDPHLGAPLWFATAPHQYTLKVFQEKTAACGVAGWIDTRVGESSAIAAIWPAAPIDAVFIDGDHSFLGALKDFECWAPKLRPGGLVLIDDTDGPWVPGLLELVALVQTLTSVRVLGQVQGITVCERTKVPARAMIEELSHACAARQVYRPWNLMPLHGLGLPRSYGKSKDWPDGPIDVIYQLGFLSRCGSGAYGFSAGTRPEDRAILYALSQDRGDGDVVALSPLADDGRDVLRQVPTRFRLLLVSPEEVPLYAPLLLPGGMMVTRLEAGAGDDPQRAAASRSRFIAAGLADNDFVGGDLHFGIWQPHHLAFEAIIERLTSAA
jgi:predicted O-methyltransferase YrrM